ncbi:probable glutathione S-transferase 7 [Mercenaria mercenaria]|uniref:probable glutathione S-transferase 7 n=1 Tax=Mercenaria mercenaria TaxID=6596 RepID=UPI00234E69BB|nr:probable glutathione S-transferase 7 [Mercenaria mercenaria]
MSYSFFSALTTTFPYKMTMNVKKKSVNEALNSYAAIDIKNVSVFCLGISAAPFGQLPILHVDGKRLAQSGAIARFLAREFGLAGKNSWEQGLVDQYMELAVDMFKEVIKWYFEKDEQKKRECLKNLTEVVYPKYCGLFQNALEQNGGKYFVGNDLTLADLAVLDIFDTPMHHTSNILDSFPKLKAHRERIASTANLASYIKKRKVTDI